MSDSISLIATTAFGLEALVKRELEELGYQANVISPGWIRFEADLRGICRANMWLRTADRVVIEINSFECKDFDMLFETTKAIHWDKWIPKDGQFVVTGRSIQSQLSSVPACQRTVKKAMAESLLKAHRTTVLPETGSLHKVEIALVKDQAWLLLDTTGPSLHKRGYRPATATAPIKETLAAAMVQLSFWNPDRPLLDPFCGTGTIPIEAALIGRNMAPGMYRDFPSAEWQCIAKDTWRDVRTEALDLMKQPGSERLLGTDNDERILIAARKNAALAGVADDIHFQQREFKDLLSKREHGCLITNPPYGERMGDPEEVEQLYRSIPETLKRLPTWSHYIITSYPKFERLIQKGADRRRKLYNGRIECTYYQFHGPRPGTVVDRKRVEVSESQTEQTSPLALKAAEEPTAVFGGDLQKTVEQCEIFSNRLAKRARHLRRWPTKRGITCLRLYERDIPEIPLVVDRYEDHLHIVEFDRPHERDLAQHADWLEKLVETASQTLDIPKDQIFLKQKHRKSGSEQHQRVDKASYELRVQEGGLTFIVNLSDYVDTGLFLDHRQTRDMVRKQASGKRVLNLFGYTGAFTVYAIDGGASSTVTVDLSKNYLSWAHRNLLANEYPTDNHQFVRADAMEFVTEMASPNEFDIAIVDPPTFSNSKRLETDWDIQRQHVELLNATLAAIKPGGMIYFSTNFRRFKLDEDALHSTSIVEISKHTIPEDYRNRRIHRCWKIHKASP
ncbi:MAG: bifunctional 23S rRNA (guanine(2069)-N(7))-methyltransferase RlmK/23S rRNA (guanine(2445)-N(2))-methyltransferase RlmL [Pirellulaceae bacterium]